ncbi:hypothetical protein [Polaribacter sp.]|uniref:hypothetical protein n=1 Tax=Polaribacter sp. TaxID=1920175 RepID=UPI003EF6A20E
MKNFHYLVIVFLASILLLSNSAQPGVWNAGGSGSFTLLYPEDTIAYKKIQMKSETIFMQLYKGFATVKGNYYFKNTSTDTLKIKVGYPINNVFKHVEQQGKLNQVNVDGLYKIKGLVNGNEAPIFKGPNAENDNWYVWEIVFPPNKITKFTVFFLVNTNNARITAGYNAANKNAFIYLIETGSLWKSPIEKGDFYTQIMDHISLDNINTSTPTPLFFNKENNILKFSISDYGYNPDPNFVITYSEKIENFNFKEITTKSESYFKAIDTFSEDNMHNTIFKPIEFKSAYEVGGMGNGIIGGIFYLAIYGIPILITVITLIILIFIYKKFIKK